MNIKLGSYVEDKITRFTGLATQYFETQHGMPMVGVQPEGDGKSIPEATFIDVNSIKVLGEDLIHLCSPAQPAKFLLGQEVKDITCGQMGIITSKTTFLNGCIVYGITMPSVDNKTPEIAHINQNNLMLISEGINKEMKSAGKKPGGPMIKASSMKVR